MRGGSIIHLFILGVCPIIKHRVVQAGVGAARSRQISVLPIISLSTYISKLDQPQLAQLTDAVIFRAGLQEQLRQAHLLAPKHHLYLPRNLPVSLLNLDDETFTTLRGNRTSQYSTSRHVALKPLNQLTSTNPPGGLITIDGFRRGASPPSCASVVAPRLVLPPHSRLLSSEQTRQKQRQKPR